MANNDWQEFLFIQGGIFNNGTITSFGNIQKELLYLENKDGQSENVICDLSHLGLLKVNGDDAVIFLQGQVTNDVKLLSENHTHYTGYCNAKGRLLALFFAFSYNNQLHLQLNSKLTEAIAKRLKMYVMRSKVIISNVSDNTVRIGLSGHKIADLLEPFFAKIPQSAFESMSADNSTLIRLPGGIPRFEIICDTERGKELWQALKKHCNPVGKACWEWLEIQAGIPDIYPNTQEEFVPQMVNLDLLEAINFKKGCYTGQEIVARTHYLGKVKRRTHLAYLNTSTPPHAGDDIVNLSGEVVGKIVRSAPAPSDGFDVLAEVRLESLENGVINWQGHELNIKALPYGLGA